MNISFEVSKKEEEKSLMHWLQDPAVLRYFPMCNDAEVRDAARIWIAYASMGSAYSCYVDGTLAGMLVLYIQSFEKLRHQCLFGIIMNPEMRGKGVGTQLIAFATERARDEHQIELLHLEVYEGNPAYAWYKRLGFVEYGRHPCFLKDSGEYITKIVMEKELV